MICKAMFVAALALLGGIRAHGAAGEPAAELAAGGRHLLVVRGGALLAAGSHDSGQLGHPGLPVTNLTALVAAPAPREALAWQAVAAGWRHSLAIAADGTLWACGRNLDGQLGDGTSENRTAWHPVGTEADWRRVAAGERHSLGVRADGSLWCWGWNGAGQLGAAAAEPVLVPRRVGDGTDWIDVAGGLTHSVALRGDGSLWSWGASRWGALGQGELLEAPAPVRMGRDSDWIRVAAGARHTLAVKRDGSLWAWGDNAAGQLGDGSSTGRPAPVRIGTAADWTAVAAGERHSAALNAAGEIWVWGANDFGQLGGAAAGAGSPVPVRAGAETVWSAMAAGNDFIAARARDGRVWVWGTMVEPRPDCRAATDAVALDEVSLQQMAALEQQAVAAIVEETSRLGDQPLAQVLAAGERHGAFIRPDGSLWAWGANDAGQLGDGTRQARPRPVRIGAPGLWAAVAAGDRHTTAIRRDGTLWSWGDNALGQTGQGGGMGSPKPMQVGTGQTWFAVACGAGHTLALQRNGYLWAWGWNRAGQVGSFGTENAPLPVPVCIGSDARSAVPDRAWDRVAAGREHSVALRRGGVWGWGLNETGQLGILIHGKTPNRYSPAPVGLPGTWRQVAPGGAHTLALQEDGALWGWGDNASGQLGTGTTEASPKPLQIGQARWKAVAAGGAHSVGIRQDGTLWAWGRNAEGQLGYLTMADEHEPLRIDASTDWVGIAAGRSHTMAVKADGSIWAWGRWSVSELESGGGAISFGGRIDE